MSKSSLLSLVLLASLACMSAGREAKFLFRSSTTLTTTVTVSTTTNCYTTTAAITTACTRKRKRAIVDSMYVRYIVQYLRAFHAIFRPKK